MASCPKNTPSAPNNKCLSTASHDQSLVPAAVPSSFSVSPTTSLTGPLHQICGRKTHLLRASTAFFRLPVTFDDHKTSCAQLYITPVRIRPSETGVPSERNGNASCTLFVNNLPIDTTSESLAQLFAQALGLSPSAIQATLTEFHDPPQGAFPRMNLLEREAQIAKAFGSSKAKHRQKPSSSSSDPVTVIPLFGTEGHSPTYAWSRKRSPTAHVTFETPDQLDLLLMIDPVALPLRWPEPSKLYNSWLDHYQARKKFACPALDAVKLHCNQWMSASEGGLIPPLPLPEADQAPAKSILSTVSAIGSEGDDDAGWTIVARGGHHGRSDPKFIQPSKAPKGADPYAQSSMATRHGTAPVKVMSRGFAQAFNANQGNFPSGKKRKGGKLDVEFYKANSKGEAKSRAQDIQRKFSEDRARLKSRKIEL